VEWFTDLLLPTREDIRQGLKLLGIACAPEITSFNLFQKTPLTDLGPLSEDEIIDYSKGGIVKLNIDANYVNCPKKQIYSVFMTFDSPSVEVCEESVPYAVFCNSVNGSQSTGVSFH
jgi:hypothetical protein